MSAVLAMPQRHAPRYYQEDALTGIERSLELFDRTLVRMATGTGKSVVFSEFSRRADGDVLLLAHRDELVQQARKHLERATGEWVEVEQGMFRCHQARLVVGSVASVTQQNRLKRMGKDRFRYIVADEAHHGVAPTWRRVFDWFHKAQVVGFTATSDRGDGKALGLVFEDTAYTFDIRDGVQQGYLAPIVGKRVRLDKIDLRKVKSVAGDLHQGQLDEVMAEAVEGIVKTTVQMYPDRKGIAFFPGVRSAEYAAHRFNHIKPHSAIMISGETPYEERRKLVSDFKAGKHQYLCNCNVATEGFDDPEVSLVIPRITKSRAAYTQMVGRGTRVLPRVVDRYEGRDAASVRREAIRHSGKPDCVVLDFVGNSGRHSLASPEDVLGGQYEEPVVKLAKKKAEEAGGGDPEEFLVEAVEDLARLAASVESDVQSSEEEFDPFSVFHNKDIGRYSVTQGYKPASDKQIKALLRMGMNARDAESASHQQARKLISTDIMRSKHGLATYRQLSELVRFGVVKSNISRKVAGEAIGYIRKSGKRPDPSKLREILG